MTAYTTQERLESLLNNISSMQKDELIDNCRKSELMNYYTVSELRKNNVEDLKVMLSNAVKDELKHVKN